ncbi:MAG: hypothetical protein HYU64_05560, partial [Armatimonadetes bacterium]|nr:hypothetical protein [Armatimonadota bacterium]
MITPAITSPVTGLALPSFSPISPGGEEGVDSRSPGTVETFAPSEAGETPFATPQAAPQVTQSEWTEALAAPIILSPIAAAFLPVTGKILSNPRVVLSNDVPAPDGDKYSNMTLKEKLEQLDPTKERILWDSILGTREGASQAVAWLSHVPTLDEKTMEFMNRDLAKEIRYLTEEHHLTDEAQTLGREFGQYLKLFAQAQREESLPDTATPAKIHKHVLGELRKVTAQELCARERALGDHGIHHIIVGNISYADQLLDGFEQAGRHVSAYERLQIRAVHYNHDLA